MAFCKYSVDKNSNLGLVLDKNFLKDYLPYAPDYCVKVYLYGLYLCSTDGLDNTLECFAKTLDMTEDDVKECFMYWQEQGLVTVLNADPIEVRYLQVKPKNLSVKKYSKSKYADFNIQMQEIINGRMITPTEYLEYYTLLETFKLEPLALIMIAKYCTNLKGNNVGYAYILTIAKNWAYEGVRTESDVENKLKEFEAILSDVSDILKLLGRKKQASFEDKQMYTKWVKNLDFNKEIISYVAKQFKKKGNMEKLNEKLEKYYELKLFSLKEIEEYEANKNSLIDQAKMVTKQIGVYYENLENVIETYIVKWQNMGYNQDSLKLVAEFCFKNNVRNLDGMDSTLEKFYSLGLINVESINEYFGQIIETDSKIKELLTLVGLNRSVTTWDRDFYRTWTYTWNFDEEIIKYACSLAVGKSCPMPYINKILSVWFKNKINTLKKAKKQTVNFNKQDNKPAEFKQRSYSSKDINALFDNLKEVKW